MRIEPLDEVHGVMEQEALLKINEIIRRLNELDAPSGKEDENAS